MRHSWRPVVPFMMGAVLDLPVVESAWKAEAASEARSRVEPKTTRAPTDREGVRKAAIVIEKVSWCCSTPALPDGTPRVHSNAGDGPALAGTSENDWFRFQPDAETAVDALLDRLGQRHHLGADRVAAVDQHQRLLLVDAGAPDRLALP